MTVERLWILHYNIFFRLLVDKPRQLHDLFVPFNFSTYLWILFVLNCVVSCFMNYGVLPDYSPPSISLLLAYRYIIVYLFLCICSRGGVCAPSLREKLSDSAFNNRCVKALDTSINKGMIYPPLSHTYT